MIVHLRGGSTPPRGDGVGLNDSRGGDSQHGRHGGGDGRRDYGGDGRRGGGDGRHDEYGRHDEDGYGYGDGDNGCYGRRGYGGDGQHGRHGGDDGRRDYGGDGRRGGGDGRHGYGGDGTGNLPVAIAYPVARAFFPTAADPDAFFAQQRAIDASHDRMRIERSLVASAREREEDAVMELRRRASVSHLTSFFRICIAAT